LENHLPILKKCPLFAKIEDESLLQMLSCLAAGRFGRRPRRGGGVAALRYGAWCAVRASVLVSLVTLPVIGGVSGRVSILTPLINLIYIPAATVLLTLCPLLLLLRFVPVLSHLLAIITEGTAAVILRVEQGEETALNAEKVLADAGITLLTPEEVCR